MPENLETFTDANFETEVLRSDLPVLVDFSADWCPPCLAFEPILEQVADAYAGRLRVGKSDVDRNAEIATRYAIHHLPTVLVFRGDRRGAAQQARRARDRRPAVRLSAPPTA